MDFSLTEEQQELGELARRILSDRVTHARLVELESGSWSVFDADAWRRLGEAGLTGVALPEDVGGGGQGFLELAVVVEEVGRAVAPVPAVPSLVTAYVLGRAGLAADVLAGAAAATAVLTAAFDAEVRAARDADGWSLDGECRFVPFGAEADLVAVPAAGPRGTVLALLPKGAAGVAVTELATTNREPQAALRLAGVRLPAAAVVSQADALVEDLRLHATAALAVEAAGVCRAALELTARYTATREQFGKPIASFQAVGQRAADAYIDAELVRLTAWQAAWRLAEGWPATDEVAVAKFWAGDGGMRCLHACQHLHGGIGVDLDYPMHRYFLWGKQIEHTLGTRTRALLGLGASLAAVAVAG